ncbi:MAG: hypothetical protein ACKVPX_13610 [Myxococcaceae bacterium]
MKRFLILAPVISMLGCGGGGDLTLASGTYRVSNATLRSATDQCGLLGVYTDPTKVIGVTVATDVATFNLANEPSAPAVSLPTSTIVENRLEQLTEGNYTIAYGGGCVVRVRRNVVGDLTENNAASVTFTFTATVDAGSCVPANTAFAALPCTSSYDFDITRQ